MCLYRDAIEKLRDGADRSVWNGFDTQHCFERLRAAEVEVGEVESFFAQRGLKAPAAVAPERSIACELVDLDMRACADALSFLFSTGADVAVCRFLPTALDPTFREDVPRLDHVGLEIFGRLEWIIDALAAWAETSPFQMTGHRIFPSVQVRKALAGDPDLAGVRVARVYFEGAGRSVNLEIFEAMQHWLFTAARELSVAGVAPHEFVSDLLAEMGGPDRSQIAPIGHIALSVRRAATVEAVDAVLNVEPQVGPAARPYSGGVSFNPGDASINIKFSPPALAPESTRRFGSIVEVISYGYSAAAD